MNQRTAEAVGLMPRARENTAEAHEPLAEEHAPTDQCGWRWRQWRWHCTAAPLRDHCVLLRIVLIRRAGLGDRHGYR